MFLEVVYSHLRMMMMIDELFVCIFLLINRRRMRWADWFDQRIWRYS